jgi:hypothetical protein
VEEDVLLPAAAHGVDPADPAVVRVLSDHVRHEEWVLFPVEEALSEADLEALAQSVEEAERSG